MNKVYKIGYLKEDLFNYHSPDSHQISFNESWGEFFLKTQDEIDFLINKFKSNFYKVLPKGTEFVCFLNQKNEEIWYDNVNYGIEIKDKDLAYRYIENVKFANNEARDFAFHKAINKI